VFIPAGKTKGKQKAQRKLTAIFGRQKEQPWDISAINIDPFL